MPPQLSNADKQAAADKAAADKVEADKAAAAEKAAAEKAEAEKPTKRETFGKVKVLSQSATHRVLQDDRHVWKEAK